MSRRLSFPFATALVLLLVASLPAFGEEWGFLGARYQGMGGAGVAVVTCLSVGVADVIDVR